MIDARATTMPANANGNQMQPIIDAVIDLVGASSLPYKIETDNGNLVGFIVLLVNRSFLTATLQASCIRPQYSSDLTAINAFINSFRIGTDWLTDILL